MYAPLRHNIEKEASEPYVQNYDGLLTRCSTQQC